MFGSDVLAPYRFHEASSHSGADCGDAAHPPEIQQHWRRRSGRVESVAADLTGGPGQRSPRAARLEAALFVADRPCSARKLVQFAAIADPDDVLDAIAELNAGYDACRSPFRVQRVATGYQLLTLPEFSPWLDKVHERHARLRLSSPAMETLSIVAYRQPILRADVEAIRGVLSGEMLKQLMERGLVRITGEDDSLGRPYLYGTTRQFLELFGLHSLSDLPGVETRRPQPDATESDESSEDGDVEVDSEEFDEEDESDFEADEDAAAA